MNQYLEAVLSVIIIVTIFISLVAYGASMEVKQTCEKLDDYGYRVRLDTSSFFPKCEVKTERGVWISSHDFNIASVEEFVRR